MEDKRSITSKVSIKKARETRKKNQEDKYKLLQEIDKHDKLIIEKYGVNTYITRRLARIETMILALYRLIEKRGFSDKELQKQSGGNAINDIISKKKHNPINQILFEMNRKYG